jgi:hypothetical protein
VEKEKSPAEIEDKLKTFRRRNTKQYRNKRIQPRDALKWAADDPCEYDFPVTPRGAPEDDPPVRMTVARYFQDIIHLPVRYPKMPLVQVKDGKDDGWYPIEFLFQAFGKTRGADFNKKVLKFNDNFASTKRMQHLEHVKMLAEEVKRESGQDLSMLLQQMKLTVSNKPMELTASVLEQPVIVFEGGNKKIPTDGSWNLAGARFPNPAFMTSFAILDFTDQNLDAFETLFRVMKDSHGIELPRNIDENQAIRDLRVHVRDSKPEVVSLLNAVAVF